MMIMVAMLMMMMKMTENILKIQKKKTRKASRHCGTCHDPCALHFHMEEPDEDFVAFVS